MKFRVVTPPDRFIAWDSARVHLRLDLPDDRAYVLDLIDAATAYAEGAMDSSLGTQTIEATFYDGDKLWLPRGPIQSITSVVDANNTTITDYTVEGYGTIDVLKVNRPYKGPLVVTYTAGFDAVPADVKQAILCHVGTLYEFRESIGTAAAHPIPHQLESFYRIRRRGNGL